jgi:hypothetical protein
MYTTTFSNLTEKRKATVRQQIETLWSEGHNAQQIAKKVRLSSRSVATAMGNLSRRPVAKAKRSR